MPYISSLFHMVWSTKNREPFLNASIRSRVFQHILDNARNKGIHMDCVNGFVDHMHCLISLSADQTISKVVQLIKGEASHWINQQKLIRQLFSWQEEYFAVSVSYSQLQKVRNYIYNQEIHHQKTSYQQEVDQLMKKYNFIEFNNFLSV